VRRPTLIVLIALFVLIVVVAVIQLTMDAPQIPFAGPTSPGELPSLSASASP
jgi:hypothetical protein